MKPPQWRLAAGLILFVATSAVISTTAGAFLNAHVKLGRKLPLHAALGAPICDYHQVTIATTQEGPPRQAISVEDLTPKLISLLEESGMKNGVVNVISRHTTTAITINERESRLARDMEEYFLKLAPPDERSSSRQRKTVFVIITMTLINVQTVRKRHNDVETMAGNIDDRSTATSMERSRTNQCTFTPTVHVAGELGKYSCSGW